MRFNEMFLKSNPNVKKLANVGSATFKKGITDKNESRTPHYEIGKCLAMFETNSIVQSAIEQLVLFIIPNKEIKIFSSDNRTKAFLEDWHGKRKHILENYKNILTTNIICGNGPMEKNYLENGCLDNAFAMNNMENLYINPDGIDTENEFILKLDVGTKQLYYNNKWQTPTYYSIRYVKNYNWYMARIYGIIIPSNKIEIYKSGWSRDNIYGRSGLASAIDANNVMTEILSSWDTISKTRQIDMKLFSVSDADTGNNIAQEQLDKLGEQLTDSENSFNIINIPLKNLFEKDIKVSGNYDLMEGVFDIVRRMVMMSLLPQHLTPWADSATTQGSEASMPPFLLRVKAKQNEFINYLNSAIIDELRKTYTWLAEDATFIFDEPIVVGQNVYIQNMNDLVMNGIITTDQARTYLLRMGILDEDLLNDTSITRDDTSPVQTHKPLVKTDDNETDELGDLSQSESKTLKEQYAGQGEIKFETFKNKMTKKGNNVNDWKEIEYRNIGGRSVRLIETSDEYKIFDGLINISNLSNKLKIVLAKSLFNEEIAQIKKEQLEIDNSETPEDIIIGDAQKDIQTIIQKKLDKLFIDIPKTARKKEAFLGLKIFDKFDDLFKGINPELNKIVSKTMTKLGIESVDINETDSKKDKDILYDKKKLLAKNVQDQIKSTKDKMLADIKRELANGIASGKSPTQIKQDVEQSYNYEDGIGWKFNRTLFTSMRQSSGILKLQKWLKQGFEEFLWSSKEDSKVRPSHAAKNGKVYKIEVALKSNKMDAYAGKDYNCRCYMMPYA